VARTGARTGVHVELRRRDAAPGARLLAAAAAPGETLVTAPVRGLLVDRGLAFAERGLRPIDDVATLVFAVL
jgi:hypothetical protein